MGEQNFLCLFFVVVKFFSSTVLNLVANSTVYPCFPSFRTMSGRVLKSLTTAENEFLAEETLITITANIDHQPFLFISGSYGPLQAGFPCDVPLWLAITLRKRGKCTIAVPDWMSVRSLEQNIANERQQTIFEPLPFHYREISQLLLNHAREDITSPDRVQVLLQDLENIRLDRARMGMLSMAEGVHGGNAMFSAGLPNISAIEILTIRRFFLESMGAFGRMTVAVDAPEVFPGSEVINGDGDEYGAVAPLHNGAGMAGTGARLRRLR